MLMALDAFKKIDLNVTIQYNNRKLLTGMLEVFGVDSKKINGAVLTLDKLEKIGLDAVIAELKEKGLSDAAIVSIKQFLTDKGNKSFDYYESYAIQNEQVNKVWPSWRS